MNEADSSVHKVSCTALEELPPPNLQPWPVQPAPFTAQRPGKERGHLIGANPKPSLLDELLELLETDPAPILPLFQASYCLYPIMLFLQFWSELNQYA